MTANHSSRCGRGRQRSNPRPIASRLAADGRGCRGRTGGVDPVVPAGHGQQRQIFGRKERHQTAADQRRPRGHFGVWNALRTAKSPGVWPVEDPLLRRDVIGVASVPIQVVRRAAGHHGDVRHPGGGREVPELKTADLQHHPIVAAQSPAIAPTSCRRYCRPGRLAEAIAARSPLPSGEGCNVRSPLPLGEG